MAARWCRKGVVGGVGKEGGSMLLFGEGEGAWLGRDVSGEGLVWVSKSVEEVWA